MSRAEDKALVIKCINELASNLSTFRGLLPCIITKDENDAKLMKDAYKASGQMLDFIKECTDPDGDMDLALLSEEFDIQGIIEEYPKIKELFSEGSSLSLRTEPNFDQY